ncbi:MAG: efflux RND transporter periplasmic adaptor subunit [Bacillota bacterium]|nr:efflux RND transporter periplasmic adaptor subunit [Bacillota bacterium]
MTEETLNKIKFNKNLVFGLLIVLIIASAAILIGHFSRNASAMADARQSLTATGTIEAKTVTAAFKVPGKIDTELVQEGDEVTKDQEVAVVGSEEIQAKATQAQGARQAALGQSQQAAKAVPATSQTVNATIKQATAIVQKATVGVTNARQQYERVQQLHTDGALSDSQLDQAKNAYEAALNDLEAAKGKLNEAQAARLKVSIAESQHEAAMGLEAQAAGAVEEAEAYLANTHLLSPIDGFITQKYLEEGEMLNAGTPVFEITDLKNTYVKVFFPETKIGRVQLKQAAEITVPAYPDEVFEGTVVWVNDAGDFAVEKAATEQSQDIRYFEVKIDVPNQDLKLKAGMTATVQIIAEEK